MHFCRPQQHTSATSVFYTLQGQVLIRNEFASVNMIDTYHRSGLYARSSFPSGLGEEGAGTVEAVGPGKKTANTLQKGKFI